MKSDKYTRRLRTWILLSVMVLLLIAVGSISALPGQSYALPVASAANNNSVPGANITFQQKGTAFGVDCSQVKQLGIDRMMNMRAGSIMVACGYAPGGSTKATGSSAKEPQLSPSTYGGADADVILPDGTSPHLTQSETFVWG